MTPTLSIRIPAIAAPPPVLMRVVYNPLPKNYYASWTAADYAFAYANTNQTEFSWDNVKVPRRSARRSAKKVINYKI
jgi:hypothetical protein